VGAAASGVVLLARAETSGSANGAARAVDAITARRVLIAKAFILGSERFFFNGSHWRKIAAVDGLRKMDKQ
jgi:hypothetical protein